jgi:flagellar protein FliO/FliZ
MFDLFGAETPLAVRFLIAFIVVLALIGATAWVVRRFGSDRLGGQSARGRQPRLAVIEASAVDARRRLVLIRRDNVEHLIMIGGPTDVVVEPNIVRAQAARETGRALPLGEPTAWPLAPEPAPAPAPVAARAGRPAAEEPQWTAPAAEPASRRTRAAESLSGLTADLSARPAAEPAVEKAAATEPAVEAVAAADQNLAEMAQRLEAALRRPAAAPGAKAAPAPADAARAQRPAEPQLPHREPKPEAQPAGEAKRDVAKNVFNSLEQEMASLLGRQSKG